MRSMEDRQVEFGYTKALDEDGLRQLCNLFEQSAFWAKDRSAEDMERAIAHSHPIVVAWSENHLVGFARATSDGIFRATIWDVMIHPDYRGAGLGKRLVKMLVDHPHMRQVERTYLMTTHHQRFYEGVGFERNGTTTMVLNADR